MSAEERIMDAVLTALEKAPVADSENPWSAVAYTIMHAIVAGNVALLAEIRAPGEADYYGDSRAEFHLWMADHLGKQPSRLDAFRAGWDAALRAVEGGRHG